jgi:hypothetical protein
MSYGFRKILKTVKNIAPLVVVLVTIFSFQNCGKFSSTSQLATQSSSVTPTVPPTVEPPLVTPPIASGAVVPTIPKDFSAGSLRVCASGCDYQTPSAAVAAAGDGAVIEIKAGDYEDCLQVHKNALTIRGIGGYAHLHTKICDGKGGIVTYGAGTRLENLELSGFDSADFSTASIRHDVLGNGLSVYNCYFHDSQNPVLLSASNDTVTFDESLFDHTGALRPDGEISVPIYEGGQNGKLMIRHSRFLHAQGGATEVKSRARETDIDCSVFANLDGSDSYSINPQLGGILSITNSVFEKGAQSQNPNFIGFGDSPNATYTHSITLTGNQFISDRSSSNLLHIFQGQATISRMGNTFIGAGAGTMMSSSGALIELNDQATNTTLADRPPSIGPFPNLPMPGACQH